MKSAALDTSVVLRLLTGTPKAQAELALADLLSRIQAGGHVHISNLVLSDVYFALQHHYRMPKGEALRLLRAFLSESGVSTSAGVDEVFQTPRLASAKPGFVDRLIHAEAMAVAEELVTFETAARRLSNVRVLKAD